MGLPPQFIMTEVSSRRADEGAAQKEAAVLQRGRWASEERGHRRNRLCQHFDLSLELLEMCENNILCFNQPVCGIFFLWQKA